MKSMFHILIPRKVECPAHTVPKDIDANAAVEASNAILIAGNCPQDAGGGLRSSVN